MSNMHFLPKSLFKYLCVDDDYLEKENWLYFIIAYDLLSSIDWPFSVIQIQISNFVSYIIQSCSYSISDLS
jgi:hypothetical protein